MKDKGVSLTAIRAFEVSARLVSFARAARELGVQPPAVSRQIAELEASLGKALFIRSKPRLTLTAAGQELFHSVSIGLNEINQACEQIRQRPANNTVRAVTSIGVTSCWLLRRLPDFYRRYPEIDLQLATRDSTANLDTEGTDIAILFGESVLPGVEQRQIFAETMITICSPAYLAGRESIAADQLIHEKLLHYLEPPHDQDWPRLLATVGQVAPLPERGTIHHSYIVYLQAALNGDGIGIGWQHLLGDHLSAGNLVRASAMELPLQGGYYACLTQQGVKREAVRTFADWLQLQGEQLAR